MTRSRPAERRHGVHQHPTFRLLRHHRLARCGNAGWRVVESCAGRQHPGLHTDVLITRPHDARAYVEDDTWRIARYLPAFGKLTSRELKRDKFNGVEQIFVGAPRSVGIYVSCQEALSHRALEGVRLVLAQRCVPSHGFVVRLERHNSECAAILRLSGSGRGCCLGSLSLSFADRSWLYQKTVLILSQVLCSTYQTASG